MTGISKSELLVLYKIFAQTADSTGTEFFRGLVRSMAEALGVRYAFIAVFLPGSSRMSIPSFWDGDNIISFDEYDYRLTPCSRVVTGTLYYCPRNVQTEFPRDAHLRELGAESYRGVPLVGPNGKHLGHLAALDVKPMEDAALFVETTRIFAARAAAELARLEAERKVAQAGRMTRAMLNGALDAIVNVDDEGKVQMFNSAAERIFEASGADVINQPFGRFLGERLLDRLMNYMKAPKKNNERVASVFLTEMTAIRNSGEEFPVEGSVSRFTLDGRDYCTVILRDVRERLHATRRIEQLEMEKDYLENEVRERNNPNLIVGRSRAISEVLQLVSRVAKTTSNILVLGETGTGKELVARSIHSQSPRALHPLIKVNCAALPASLIESELFGHELGSFTGATRQRVGRFELANLGTIFLDEIGDLPLDLQAKLLRVLQEQEFERVGGNTTLKVDVRVIAATNRNLEDMITKGKFREDLYYRLSVVPITVPPLRERKDDIPQFARFFVERFSVEFDRGVLTIDDEIYRRLKNYRWPGNVRELENVIERAVILSPGSELQIPEGWGISQSPSQSGHDSKVSEASNLSSMESVERRHIQEVLDLSDWIIEGPSGAAVRLDLNPGTLRSRMKKLGISRDAK